jgi:hypothetical protein
LIIFVVAVILRCAVTTLYVAAFDEPEAVRHGHHSRPGEHAMVKGDALNYYLWAREVMDQIRTGQSPLGPDLRGLRPGSPEAARVKDVRVAWPGHVVAVPRGRHWPGRGAVYQVSAHGPGRLRGAGRHSPAGAVEAGIHRGAP